MILAIPPSLIFATPPTCRYHEAKAGRWRRCRPPPDSSRERICCPSSLAQLLRLLAGRLFTQPAETHMPGGGEYVLARSCSTNLHSASMPGGKAVQPQAPNGWRDVIWAQGGGCKDAHQEQKQTAGHTHAHLFSYIEMWNLEKFG